MEKKHTSVSEIVEFESLVNIVDIGANLVDGDPPYKLLLKQGLAQVIGFEPNQEALNLLNSLKGVNETYLPDAVFDGSEQEYKMCFWEGMNSLLEPNQDLLGYFHGFSEGSRVSKRIKIPTVRLDDVHQITDLDYLKIDIQGGELEVFRNGVKKLRDCLVIQTEVEFLPMYEGQPLFSEVESFLRTLGFIFHRFDPIGSRTVQPMIIDGDIHKGLSQTVWADAIFIKDFRNFDQLSLSKLKKLALILNDIYSSWDIVLRALMAHDDKAQSDLAKKYIAFHPFSTET